MAQDSLYLVAGLADPELAAGAVGRLDELRGGDGFAFNGLRRGKRIKRGRARLDRFF